MGLMCFLLQPWPCRLAPMSGSCPPRPPPHPLLLRAPSLSPLGFSSHGNHWRPHSIGLLISEAPGLGACGSSPSPYHGAVCCWLLLLPPGSEAPFSLPQSPQASPGAPKPPGPAASPDPLAGPKHSVAAERHVDIQVYLHDVPGGDQGVLLHFLWENRGGGTGVRDTDPTCHEVPCWAGSPGATMGVCTAETSFLPLGGRAWRECPLYP